MSTIKKIIYDSNDQAKFIHNVNEIDIPIDGAEFKIVNDQVTKNQDYVSDTGFTYDSNLAEFVAGSVRKKDQSGGFDFGINFKTKDANFGPGTLTGTLVGAASIIGEELDFANGGYEDFSADNINFTNIATFKQNFTPKYSGAPSTAQRIFDVGNEVDNENRLLLVHLQTSGYLAFIVFNSAGTVQIVNTNVAGYVWSPVASQKYRIRLEMDIVTGASKIFINDIQLGATQIGTGTRTNSGLTVMRFGDRSFTPEDNANFLLDDFTFANEIISTTGDYSVPDYIYLASDVDLPQIVYTGPGIINSLDSVTNTGVNVPPLTNVFDDDSIDVQLNFESSNTQQEVSNTEIKYSADFYPEYSLIEPTEYSPAQGFDDLEENSIISGDGAINYLCKIEFAYYYIDTGVLTVSDKSYVQSTTIAGWLANKAVVDAFINSGARITFLPLPYSGVGRNNNFKLVDTTLAYDYSPVATGCEQCTLYGFLSDNCVPVKTMKVTIKTEKPIYTQGKVQAFEEDAEIELSNGSFEIPLVIPNLPIVADRKDDHYLLNAEWTDLDDVTWNLVDVKIIIPNQPTVLFDENIIKKGR